MMKNLLLLNNSTFPNLSKVFVCQLVDFTSIKAGVYLQVYRTIASFPVKPNNALVEAAVVNKGLNGETTSLPNESNDRAVLWWVYMLLLFLLLLLLFFPYLPDIRWPRLLRVLFDNEGPPAPEIGTTIIDDILSILRTYFDFTSMPDSIINAFSSVWCGVKGLIYSSFFFFKKAVLGFWAWNKYVFMLSAAVVLPLIGSFLKAFFSLVGFSVSSSINQGSVLVGPFLQTCWSFCTTCLSKAWQWYVSCINSLVPLSWKAYVINTLIPALLKTSVAGWFKAKLIGISSAVLVFCGGRLKSLKDASKGLPPTDNKDPISKGSLIKDSSQKELDTTKQGLTSTEQAPVEGTIPLPAMPSAIKESNSSALDSVQPLKDLADILTADSMAKGSSLVHSASKSPFLKSVEEVHETALPPKLQGAIHEFLDRFKQGSEQLHQATYTDSAQPIQAPQLKADPTTINTVLEGLAQSLEHCVNIPIGMTVSSSTNSTTSPSLVDGVDSNHLKPESNRVLEWLKDLSTNDILSVSAEQVQTLQQEKDGCSFVMGVLNTIMNADIPFNVTNTATVTALFVLLVSGVTFGNNVADFSNSAFFALKSYLVDAIRSNKISDLLLKSPAFLTDSSTESAKAYLTNVIQQQPVMDSLIEEVSRETGNDLNSDLPKVGLICTKALGIGLSEILAVASCPTEIVPIEGVPRIRHVVTSALRLMKGT